MARKRKILLIAFGLVLAVSIPLLIRLIPVKPQTRTIDLQAKKYGYSPSRIVVNRGDKIILKPTSLDVTHGFLLDGYPVEFIIKQKGINFLKYTWEDDQGKPHADWDKVPEVEFAADKSGRFTFRCTQTCGNLHPFMTGELIVRPNTFHHLFISLSIWMTLSFLLLISGESEVLTGGFKRINLLTRFPWLKALVKSRSFQFMVLFPNLIVFYLFLLSGLWGSPVGNRNIAIIFVWIAWWFVLKAILVPLGGRLWCMICPLPAPAEWLSRRSLTAVRYVQKPFRGLRHRFTGLQRDWPKALNNMWLQNFLFLSLISFGIILITRPVATAFLFMMILWTSLCLALIFRRRVFCRYLCPVGGFVGTYSMAAMTEIRVIDPEICKTHKEKECYLGGRGGWACPWDQYPGKMRRNNYCGLCTECIKSCPKDNIGLFVRPFGSDRILNGYDEMFNVIIMLVVAMAFSITMLGPWGPIKAAANVTESGQIMPFLLYLAAVWGSALLFFPGLFLLAAKASNRLAGGDVPDRDMILRLAYTMIPLGIFAWISFSLPPVMVNYNYILSVLSDPFGLGWNIFGTANYPFKPLLSEWIPVIQGVILLAGLYLGLTRGRLALKTVEVEPAARVKALIPVSFFALLIMNLFSWLFMG